MIRISLIIWLVYMANEYSSQEADVHANVTQVFIHKISPEMLSWSEKGRPT